MKKRKKIVCIALSFILIISITAAIFIATANTKETNVVITVDKAELSSGQSATVSVNVKTNYPVATMSIPVFYDKSLVDVSDVTATLSDYAVKSAITDAQSKDISKIYTNTGINSDKYGFVLVTYIGGAGKEVPETTDGVVLTFKITAKQGVNGTETIKCVNRTAKTSENTAGMLYFGATVNENVIDSIPENVENIDLTKAQANVNIGSQLNTLMFNENAPFEAIIDLDNNLGGEFTGTIYGFDTLGWNEDWTADGTIADFFTTAYGVDYLEVIVPEDAGVETTGTIVNVLDEEGNVVESYMYIYFGDMDGDGAVGFSDSAIAYDYEMLFEGIETLDTFMAGDLDADTMPGFADSAYMFDWEMLAEGMPYQADIATNVYGNIVYEIF